LALGKSGIRYIAEFPEGIVATVVKASNSRSKDAWKKVMAKVWQAQKKVKPSERTPNPVLLERQRRRR
jgi:hypothetical protein